MDQFIFITCQGLRLRRCARLLANHSLTLGLMAVGKVLYAYQLKPIRRKYGRDNCHICNHSFVCNQRVERVMSEKFTAGPWATSYRQRNDGMYSQEVYDTEGKTICSCSWYKVDGGIVEVEGKIYQSTKTNREHNAHLIAAAPEMYEMLKECQSEIGFLINEVNQHRTTLHSRYDDTPPDMHDQESLYLIGKLLAKARGED